MSGNPLYDLREEILPLVFDENSYVPLKMIDKYILLLNDSELDKSRFVKEIISKIEDLNLKKEALIKEKESLIKDNG